MDPLEGLGEAEEGDVGLGLGLLGDFVEGIFYDLGRGDCGRRGVLAALLSVKNRVQVRKQLNITA